MRAGGLRVQDSYPRLRPGCRLLRHHLRTDRSGRQRAARGRALGIPADLEFLTMIRSWLDR